jgi:hypothetical protein
LSGLLMAPLNSRGTTVTHSVPVAGSRVTVTELSAAWTEAPKIIPQANPTTPSQRFVGDRNVRTDILTFMGDNF